ncbi:MAG TPA: hypothetical protein VI381_05420, partial [Allosphingosinicella sp.]
MLILIAAAALQSSMGTHTLVIPPMPNPIPRKAPGDALDIEVKAQGVAIRAEDVGGSEHAASSGLRTASQRIPGHCPQNPSSPYLQTVMGYEVEGLGAAGGKRRYRLTVYWEQPLPAVKCDKVWKAQLEREVALAPNESVVIKGEGGLT